MDSVERVKIRYNGMYDPADKTKGCGPMGIARAVGEDAVKGTFTDVMNIDRGRVVTLDATRKMEGN